MVGMDVGRILEQLHQELVQIDAAIFSLERLLKGSRRRGRPPAWLAAVRRGEIPSNDNRSRKPNKKSAGRRPFSTN
jgi:hypothetical protein